MTVRTATPGDWLSCRTLRLAALQDTPDAFAAVGLAVVGMADHPDDAGLYSVWVAPDARGRGLGDALVRAAIGSCTCRPRGSTSRRSSWR